MARTVPPAVPVLVAAMGWGVAGERGASYLRLYLVNVADCRSTAWVSCLAGPVSCRALESIPLQEAKGR